MISLKKFSQKTEKNSNLFVGHYKDLRTGWLITASNCYHAITLELFLMKNKNAGHVPRASGVGRKFPLEI
jgi:hypothetical protein